MNPTPTPNPRTPAAATARTRAASRRRRLALPGVVVGTGAAVAVGWALWRGAEPYARLGLSAPEAGVIAAVPLVRLVVAVAGASTLGLLVAALWARPNPRPTLGPHTVGAHTYRALHWAAVAATVWALAASVASVLLVVAGTGGSARALARPAALLEAMGILEEPAAMLVGAVAASVVALVCRVTLSWRSGLLAVAVAALGVAAPAVTGQVASAGAGHDVATDAALLAALAGALWLGGALLAVLDPTDGAPGSVRTAARRSATLMRAAGVVTLAATLVAQTVLVRGQYWSDAHGRWAAVQLILLGLALAITLTGTSPGTPSAGTSSPGTSSPGTSSPGTRPHRAPCSLLVLLLGASTAAVIAATEPAPAIGAPATIHEILIGFDLVDPPTLLGLIAPGRLNLLWLGIAVTLTLGYLAGVARLARRGDRWSRGRTTAWLAGCALLAWTTGSELGALSMGMFSAHMGSHMLLAMTVPALLVLGGPLTLALRALSAGDDGPRAALVSLSTSPAARTLTHPVVALALFVGPLYGLYFSGLFDAALPYHWAHQLMTAHFLVSGYLFMWLVIGVDHLPRPLPHVGRLALLLASMPFHAFFGVALLGAEEVVGDGFYRELALPWVPDLLADQFLAGGIAWAAGEVPLVVVLIALLVQWSRHDRRDADRADRRADRDGDAELAAWNAMLADLAGRR